MPRTRKNKNKNKNKKKGGNEIPPEAFQQVGQMLYEQENPFQSNHIFIGYRDMIHDRTPIIVPKNIQFKRIGNNEIIDGYILGGQHPQLILPYIYQLDNFRNIQLFDRKGYYDEKGNFIEATGENAKKIQEGILRRLSFIDENDNIILRSFSYVANGTTEQQYINKYRQQIDEVMEKYPGLFAPIN
jgi:hypothetical protein